MKKLISLLLAASLLFSAVGATGGDPNIDSGGGDVGHGGVVGDSAWNPGDDGVRVSIMRGTSALLTFDLSNEVRSRTQRWFYWRNKLEYKNGGVGLTGTSDPYSNWTPPPENPLPAIVPSGGGNNIEAIRRYFTDEDVVRFITSIASTYIPGLTYEEMTGGEYKLMLEPMAYFKYNGIQYAMSATEAALVDIMVSGDLRYQMGSLTHQNLPLSMYLEYGDLTIGAWTGGTSGRQSNIDILDKLGVGIVSFTPEPPTPPTTPAEYVYRADTDVITAALVPNNGGDLTPTSEADGDVGYATFRIGGTTYRKQMVCPAGESQLMWIDWHTPDEARDMVITVTPPNGGDDIEIPVSIVKLEEKTPPDPGYDGPGVGPGITGAEYRPGFRPVDVPDWGGETSVSWDQWVATLEEEWIEDGQWIDDGEWVDDGEGGLTWEDDSWWEDTSHWEYYWDWSLASYDAGLRVDFEIVPDSRVRTAVRHGGEYYMGAGYGVDAVCSVTVSSSPGASNDDVTPAQNVVAVFPEFDYATYDRLLVPEREGQYRSTWGFKPNPYSYYSEPVHFTPVWYPDGEYTVGAAVFDVWTPGGMLYASVQDTIQISGTVYDDWVIRVVKN